MDAGPSIWEIRVNYDIRAFSNEADWDEVVWGESSAEAGVIVATRVDELDSLTLTFNERYAELEYRASRDGPRFGARVPDRASARDEVVSLPCPCCGVCLDVPGHTALPKGEAVTVFEELVRTGRLPDRVSGKERRVVQRFLPGMAPDEEVARTEWDAVVWKRYADRMPPEAEPHAAPDRCT